MNLKSLKKLAVAVAFGTAVLAAGCVAGAAGNMTIGVTSFADTLEPTEQYFSWVISRYGVGQGLTKFDEEGNMVPCLATEWSGSEDGKTWTFTLRDDVKFSNGNDMTPELVRLLWNVRLRCPIVYRNSLISTTSKLMDRILFST